MNEMARQIEIEPSTTFMARLNSATTELILALRDPQQTTRLRALEAAARAMAMPVLHEGGGVAKQTAVDALYQCVSARGLVEDVGEDVVCTTIGRGLESFPEDDAPSGAQDYAPDLTPPIDNAPPVGEPAKPISLVSVATLVEDTVPKRRWLVPGRIPMRAPTILSGDGAAGKTTILMQLCEAVVSGTDWLGAVVEEPGPALFVSAEEEQDEIHRRFASIAAHTGRGFGTLGALHFLALPGESCELGAAGRDGIVRPTPLFSSLERSIADLRPKLVAIEAAADVYAGDENSRPQVRQFVQLLRRLAMAGDCAVVLVQHPSVAGMAEGQGRSGSTAWRNSVRAQLYFASAKRKGAGEDEEDGAGDVRELKVVKSNYSPSGERVAVRWDRGVFVPAGGAGPLERAAAEQEVDALFLALLEQRTAQGRPVSDKDSRSGAPHVFSLLPEAKGVTKNSLRLAMERLLSRGTIKVEISGRPSHPDRRLIRAEEAAG